jgi:hypothetical protein
MRKGRNNCSLCVGSSEEEVQIISSNHLLTSYSEPTLEGTVEFM